METLQAIERTQKMLDANSIFADVYQWHDISVVAVEINWGDWKHDHWRTDYLVNQIGGKKLKEQTTEEDGSDCYSSIHFYIFPD